MQKGFIVGNKAQLPTWHMGTITQVIGNVLSNQSPQSI